MGDDSLTVTGVQQPTHASTTSIPPKSVQQVANCSREHRLEDLVLEDNSAYWGQGFFLEGIGCICCRFKFKKVRPSKSRGEINPGKVHFCPNLMESNGSICMIALCHACWNKELLERDGKSSPAKNKRKRTPKQITSL